MHKSYSLQDKLFHKLNKYFFPLLSHIISSHFHRTFPTISNFFSLSFMSKSLTHTSTYIIYFDIHRSNLFSLIIIIFPVADVVVTNLMWWRWAEKKVQCTVSISLRWIVLENNLKLLCLALCLDFLSNSGMLVGFIDTWKL